MFKKIFDSQNNNVDKSEETNCFEIVIKKHKILEYNIKCQNYPTTHLITIRNDEGALSVIFVSNDCLIDEDVESIKGSFVTVEYKVYSDPDRNNHKAINITKD